MEKPDRDFAQAQRAADEYKTLIQQYPDSPLVPQAKQKLREVQEVLAERQYRIAHFYYLRENLAASQARLQSLTDSYPLYSGIDEALYELGLLYEKEAAGLRRQKIPEAQKEKLLAQFEKKAVEAYSKIITRYPATDRVPDAKKRLEALKAAIPEPTAEALAESKAEEASREKVRLVAKVTGNFKKHPNPAPTSKVGEPNLQEEQIKSAPEIVNSLNAQLIQGAQASQNIGVQAVGTGTGTPGENEKAPGSSRDSDAAKEGTAPPPAPAAQADSVLSRSFAVDLEYQPSGNLRANTFGMGQKHASVGTKAVFPLTSKLIISKLALFPACLKVLLTCR
jgi:outer membrane protein assembly factor BamD